MRITHVVENLNRGGLERVVIDLVAQQRRSGHDCQVVCLFEPGQLAPEVVDLGVPLVSCGKGNGLDLVSMWRLRRALRVHSPETLHTHNAMAHYYAVAASWGLSMRRINTRHGLANLPFSWKREFLYRLAMKFSDVAAVVCDKARNNFVRYRILEEGNARTVYNGIPVERFAPRNAIARRALLAETGWPADALVLGCVARLNPAKDHGTLLQSVALLRKQVPTVRLAIVGDGPLRAQLVDAARGLEVADVVWFSGDRGDVRDLLPGLDVFVLSSVTEGYSISLLEACASALPVVATDVGGNSEIIRDGINGYLVAARSPAELASALVRLATSEALRLEIGQRNRQFAEQQGSVVAMAERYDRLYRDASGMRGGAGQSVDGR